MGEGYVDSSMQEFEKYTKKKTKKQKKTTKDD